MRSPTNLDPGKGLPDPPRFQLSRAEELCAPAGISGNCPVVVKRSYSTRGCEACGDITSLTGLVLSTAAPIFIILWRAIRRFEASSRTTGPSSSKTWVAGAHRQHRQCSIPLLKPAQRHIVAVRILATFNSKGF